MRKCLSPNIAVNLQYTYCKYIDHALNRCVLHYILYTTLHELLQINM